jgi:hypothetical protein
MCSISFDSFRALVCSFNRDGRLKRNYEFRLITKIPFVYVYLIEYNIQEYDEIYNYYLTLEMHAFIKNIIFLILLIFKLVDKLIKFIFLQIPEILIWSIFIFFYFFS